MARGTQPAVEDRHFNRDLDRSQGICYSIILDTEKDEIILTHWGPSEVYCRKEKPLVWRTTKVKDLCFFSISASTHDVRFNNLFTSLEPIPSPLLKKGQKIQVQPQHRQQGQQLPQQGQPISAKVSNWFSFFKSTLQDCPKDKQCTTCYCNNENDPVRIQHTKEFKHSCLWGDACTKVEPVHQERFSHATLPPCKFGEKCSKLEDVDHRSQYSHPKMWDFLLPCRSGQNCSGPCDKTKYYH